MKEPLTEELDDADNEEEDAKTAAFGSLEGAFMDLLEQSLLLLLLHADNEAFLLCTSGLVVSGFGMIFVLLQSEPEHFIFLLFLLF